MSLVWTIVYTVLHMIFSILILWKTSLMMIDKKRIIIFLPFVLVGFLFTFKSAFTFFGLFNTIVWVYVEVIYSIVFIWLLINIWRNQNGFI